MVETSSGKLANVVELRVHGVSGTPPEDMLDSPLVRQVAGDREGRFFRRATADGAVLPGGDGSVVEGYHWGPLTSGSWRQALWLVLIPFGLVNAAYFMLPAPVRGAGRWPRLVARGALRALGIVLTAVLVLSVAQAVVDLVAWQWTGLSPDGGAAPRAADPRWWLVGTFVVAALSMVAVRLLSGSARDLPDRGRWEPPAELLARTDLAGGEFYTGDEDVPALHRLHTAAGLSVLSVLAAAVARAYAESPGLDVLYWVGVGLLVLSVVHAALIGDPLTGRDAVRRFVAEQLPAIELSLAVGVFVAALVAVRLRDNLPAVNRGVLPGVADVGLWVSGAALLALLVLAVSGAVLALRTRARNQVPRPFGRYLMGMAGPVIAALGVFLAVGFTAALDYGVLRVLRPANPPQAMQLPLFHLRIAYAAGLAVALAAVGVLVGWLLKRMTAKGFETAVRAASNLSPPAGGETGSGLLPAAEVRNVARAWWLGRVKYHVQWPVIVLAAAGTLVTAVAVVEAIGDLIAAGGHASDVTVCRANTWPPWLIWLDWLSDCLDRPGLDLVTIGTLALLLLGAGLLYLGRSALGDSTVRRSACVVWDLVAFWPRAAHPLVPPPYAPKVIEDLRRRIAWHLGECSELAPDPDPANCICPKSSNPASLVILAGHSQGSLISIAALTRLSEAYRPRVALLTYGSQLQIAYARGFPAYVNYPYLRWILRTAIPNRWRSLYRETDPIGGPVLSWDRSDTTNSHSRFTSLRLDQDGEPIPTTPCDDDIDDDTGVRRCGPEWRLLDPQPADGQDIPHWGMRRHSSYTLDPAWQHALADLAAHHTPSQP